MPNVSYPRICVYRQIVEAKLYMDNQFRENIDLEVVARQASLSKFHFHRLFKDCYGLTPLQYVTTLRMKEARRMLEAGFSTTEACFAVGFSSISSFSKLFKKEELITPSEYASVLRGRNVDATLEPLHHIPFGYVSFLGWDIQQDSTITINN